MRDFATFLLVGAAAFLVYKALENKPINLGSNAKEGDNKKTLPPLAKDQPQLDEFMAEDVVIEPIEVSMPSTFDVNVVDPKFGNNFFNNGISVY